ncbi:hypothetical protein N7501_005046 [Penicillium viridicatum]|nr:hypothetical protein N7501_005046 [Penicillium viridicatum]
MEESIAEVRLMMTNCRRTMRPSHSRQLPVDISKKIPSNEAKPAEGRERERCSTPPPRGGNARLPANSEPDVMNPAAHLSVREPRSLTHGELTGPGKGWLGLSLSLFTMDPFEFPKDKTVGAKVLSGGLYWKVFTRNEVGISTSVSSSRGWIILAGAKTFHYPPLSDMEESRPM